MKNTVTVWITKYALTQGILEKEGTLDKDGWFHENDRFSYLYWSYSYSPKEFCLSLSKALEDFEKKRQKQIESAEKRIKRLKALEVKIIKN